MEIKKIETFSIVAGSEACNARCPFCVSKMTPPQGMTIKPTPVNWPRFERACQYAFEGTAGTAMITGKGEPTLFPEQITQYLQRLKRFEGIYGYKIPNKELQTNGLMIAEKEDAYNAYLADWQDLGMKTIAISMVDIDPEKNRQIYLPYKNKYPDLSALINNIHNRGLTVRLACILAGGFIDSLPKLLELVDFAKSEKVEQLTARPVNSPDNSGNGGVFEWVSAHQLERKNLEEMHTYLTDHAVKVRDLSYGATVYDLDGQNVCLTNSLTPQTTSTLRQLIFFPNGIISTDWTEEGDNLP